MQFTRTNINKTFRNGVVNASNVAVTNVGGGGGSSSLSGNFLPAVNNGDGSYTVDLSKVVFTGNLIGEGEITAYGQGSTGGGSTSTGSVTIYDGLDSVAVDAALSANQGRILREMILEAGTGGSTLLSKLEDVTLTNLADGQILKYDAASKKWVNGDGTKVTWTNIEGKPAALTDANIAKWNENNHTHTNKTTLDKITEANLTSWNNKLDKTVWDKAFYFDSAGDLRAKVNVIGEKEISAYGAGTTSGAGTVTIVDALTSTATDCALSANMGRILKDMIDSKGAVSSWEDITDKPSWITSTKPSYSWNEITGKPSTFTPSEHTHNYASSVKVGSTSYNVSGNTISLPAYPTVPSALKNPNALTISLNGTSQGAYDGSAAKSFNITAASVGAAASSHSHSISNVSGLQDALNGKAASSHNHNSSYVSALGTNGNYLTWTKNGTTNNITVPYATAANKVTNTLTFTGYQSKSFNGSAAVSVAIPNNTNQLANGAGFITSSASISGNAGSATKLQTARTIWGQSFNGTGNVSGSMTGVGAISMSGNLTMAHSSTPTLTLKNNNSADVQIILDRNANASWKILNQSGTLYFQNNWVNGGKGSYFTALSIAYQTGHIVSKGNITSNGEITAYSDIRLKTDILPLENRGYIKPVTYKKDGKDSIGFIAQEVRELYPELVIEDNTEDKYLSVNYAQYVAVLQAQIIDLKKEIDELKNIKTK
jgi:hypothetical protein